jgi:ZIP family zinc transporter
VQSDVLTIIAVAGVAAVASPVGGLIALWSPPTSLLMSLALGFAGGTLLGTISFEMLPNALEASTLWAALVGFVLGFLAVYGLDLFVNRGRLAGEKAEQQKDVVRFHRRHPPRGDEVTVLAGGTSAEELIEGLSIGVGAAINPGLGLMVALAIMIDNLAESLSIGELIRDKQQDKQTLPWRRTLGWTGLIGASLFASAMIGWFLLRGLPPSVLGFLFAVGGGAMFYLTMTDLVPDAEERHFQQSAALAIAAGFLTSFALSQWL